MEISVASIMAVTKGIVGRLACSDPESSIADRFSFSLRVMDPDQLEIAAEHIEALHHMAQQELTMRRALERGEEVVRDAKGPQPDSVEGSG